MPSAELLKAPTEYFNETLKNKIQVGRITADDIADIAKEDIANNGQRKSIAQKLSKELVPILRKLEQETKNIQDESPLTERAESTRSSIGALLSVQDGHEELYALRRAKDRVKKIQQGAASLIGVMLKADPKTLDPMPHLSKASALIQEAKRSEQDILTARTVVRAPAEESRAPVIPEGFTDEVPEKKSGRVDLGAILARAKNLKKAG